MHRIFGTRQPPKFMLGKAGYDWTTTIEDWVNKHFVTGPDNKEILRIIQDLKRIGLTVKTAQENITRIAEGNKPNDGQETIPIS